MLIALSSAKQNADYRISCNNEQPGIENTCRAIISEYKLKTKYESLTKYYGKGVSSDAAKKESSIGKTNIVSTQSNNDYLKVRITVGAIVFEAEGTPQTVIAQEKTFSKELLPNAIAALDGIYTEQKKGKENNKKKRSPRTQREETTLQLSVGSQLAQKHKGIENLKDKMDFKAKMIPLMFLATEDKLLKDFSIKEIQQILVDALGITADKKQIVDVFDRRSDWFELTAPNPKRYKLLDIGKDYARNVLQG